MEMLLEQRVHISTRKPRGEHKSSSAHLQATAARQRLIVRLHEEGAEDLAEILQSCGVLIQLRCTGCGRIRPVESRCEKRWCPVCMRRIAAERVARYSFAVERMQWPLFVTLTVRNSLEAWAGLRHLKSSWGRMRRSKWFKKCSVRGGVTAIEITNRGNGWHPHLHSVIDCRWLAVSVPPPQKGDTRTCIAAKCATAKAELDAEWAKCTRQATASTYVKRTSQEILREVLKYSVDPGSLAATEGRISELIRAMDKFRLVQPFGNCMGIGPMIREMERASRIEKACEDCGETHWRMEGPYCAGNDPLSQEYKKAPWEE